MRKCSQHVILKLKRWLDVRLQIFRIIELENNFPPAFNCTCTNFKIVKCCVAGVPDRFEVLALIRAFENCQYDR